MSGSKKTEFGTTLIELMIVIVIIGLVSTFALIALADSQTRLDRQNIARQFKKIGLERARFDAVKRNTSVCENMSRVEIKNATSFTLLTDQNQDGTLNPNVDLFVPNEIEIVMILVRISRSRSALTNEGIHHPAVAEPKSVLPSSEPVGISFLAPQYDLSGGGNSSISYSSSVVGRGLLATNNFALEVVEE